MHLCLFDIDGTLLLSGGAGAQAFEETFLEDFGVEKFAGDVSFSGRSDRAIIADLFRVHGLEDNQAHLQKFLRGYLNRLERGLRERQGEVLPGVLPLVEELTARDDVAVGLLTGNIREGAYCKLRHFGLDHFFPFGGFGDVQLERSAIAREALEAGRAYVQSQGGPADLDGHVVVVLGDTPNDIRCARAIQATAVALATGMYEYDELVPHEPDLLLEDLSDPRPVLELLER